MIDSEVEVLTFDPDQATEDDFVAINAYDNRMRVEAWPGDPPAPLEQTRQQWRGLPSYIDQRTWFVWRKPRLEIVAQGGVTLLRTPENRHAAWAWIGVGPERRRKGIATALLRLIVDAARLDGRRLLIGMTSSTVPAGAAFMARLGAQSAQATYTNQLDIEDLNHGLVREWLERSAALHGEFELVLVEGAYPESELEAIAELQTVMNTAPRDDLDVEDSRGDPDQLRQLEAYYAEQKTERWMMYLRHLPSSRLAGYTEVYWEPTQPHVLNQGDTGVFPKYRTRGLGTWLKAAMIEKVLRDRPEVRLVRTGNAQSNAPMLRINEQLGFRPYRSNINWQVEIERVEAWLASRAAAVSSPTTAASARPPV